MLPLANHSDCLPCPALPPFQAAAAKTRTVQYLQDTKLVGAPATVQVGAGRRSVAPGAPLPSSTLGSAFPLPPPSPTVWLPLPPCLHRRLGRSARR